MRIGEAAAAAGVTPKALGFHEDRGLLQAPERNANGYRQYLPGTSRRRGFIPRSRAAGLMLSQVTGVPGTGDPEQICSFL